MRISSGDERRRINQFYRESPPVGESLPVTLRNGSTVTELTCCCVGCSSELPESQVHGRVMSSVHGGYRLTAFGLCEPCNLLTPLLYDLVESGPDGFEVVPRAWRGWKAGNVVALRGVQDPPDQV